MQSGMKMGIPVALGYFPVAMTFGMFAKSGGISFFEVFLFSGLVYAGASQFMALKMLLLGIAPLQIIIATFLLNFRHFLMSASLSQRLLKTSRRLHPLIAFGVTDETFSVSMIGNEKISADYLIGINLVAYLSWVGGSFSGYLIGEVIPSSIGSSMGVGIYSLFTAILIPQIKKNKKLLIIAILSGIINTILKILPFIPSGWSIVLSITIVSAGAALVDERKMVDGGIYE